MAEYIERGKLSADFELCNKQNPRWTPQRVASLIARANAADVAPVVRCKDCVSGHEQLYGNLFRCNVMGCGGLKPDDFCSYGEKRCNDET